MTVHYCVADAENPNPEPYFVLEIDTEKRVASGGCEAVVVSLHMTQDEADAAAVALNGRVI